MRWAGSEGYFGNLSRVDGDRARLAHSERKKASYSVENNYFGGDRMGKRYY